MIFSPILKFNVMTLIAYQPYPPKEVFFLGAGTSVSGGVPTFANFHDKSKEVLTKMLRNGYPNTEIEIFQKVLGLWKTNFFDYNIEEYYSAIELNEQLNCAESITTEDIVRFIAITIKNSIHEQYTESYKLLVKYAVVKAIITTNWDILLERSLIEAATSSENAFINYDEMIEPYDAEISPNQRDGYIPPILKLHGSLNWSFCKKCGKIYYFHDKIYTQLISRSGLKCKIHNDINLIPLIIPPTLSKLEKTAEIHEEKLLYVPLSSIWSKASEYLRLCEKVYIIG